MSKPIPAINRYHADLREFQFLLFEQFKLERAPRPGPLRGLGRRRDQDARSPRLPLGARGDRPAQRDRRRRGLHARRRQGHHADGLQGGVEEALRRGLEVDRRRRRVRRRRRAARGAAPRRGAPLGREHGVQHVRRARPTARPRSSRRSARPSRRSSTASACLAARGAARCASPSRTPAATSASARTSATQNARRHLQRSAAPRSSSPPAITISPRTSCTSCSRAPDGARRHQGAHALHRAEAAHRRRRQARRANDVAVGTIEHKMGINGSATCVLNFGENGTCIGVPVGGEAKLNQGMPQMFKHDERRAHRRRHAGLLGGVERVLERARVREGAQAGLVDQAFEGPDGAARADHRARRRAPHAPRHEVARRRHPRARDQARAPPGSGDGARGQGRQAVAYHQGQVDLLVPLVKAYGSDQGFRVCETAIQTYGGAGYTRDYPVEQYCRDAKIFSHLRGHEPHPGDGPRRAQARPGAAARTCRRSSATSASSSPSTATHPKLGGEVKKLGAAQEALDALGDEAAHVVPDRASSRWCRSSRTASSR